MSLIEIAPKLPYGRKIIAFYSYKGGVGRTMAMCNVASHIARENAEKERREARILCMDLDLEAPGVSSYLPPAPGESEKRGFLGLIMDTLGDRRGRTTELAQDLKGRLCVADSPYVYEVPDATGLSVMPSGSLPGDERAAALDLLHGLLVGSRAFLDSHGKAREIEFFEALRKTLCALFTYVLVDSRTGLADEAFATTVHLADAMVLLFRPSRTQVLGVQDVMTTFLYTRGLKSTDQDLPVVPVLSPRPPYSDPRLKSVRRVAMQKVFKWLVDENLAKARRPYTANSAGILELPHDASVEIGESLLISPSPDTEIPDPEAPLYKAYVELAQVLQRGNAKHDIDGTKILESELWHSDRRAEAFDCLLSVIARDPDDKKHWKDVWKGYSEHLTSSPESRRKLEVFCGEALALPNHRLVSCFFANLWLSEVFRLDAPEMSLENIRAMWLAAKNSEDPDLTEYALASLGRLYESREGEQACQGLPSRTPAIEAASLAILLGRSIAGAKAAILALAKLYAEMPSRSEALFRAIQDLLWLEDKPESRAHLLCELGLAYRLVLDLGGAVRAYRSATMMAESSERERQGYVCLVHRMYGLRKAEEELKFLSDVWQQRVSIILAVRERNKIESIQERLAKLEQHHPGIAQDPTWEYYALVYQRQYAKAASVLVDKLDKVRGGVGLEDDLRIALANWLADRDRATAALLRRAQVKAEKESVPPTDLAILVLLAQDPSQIARLTSMKLSDDLWPRDRFGWLVLACATQEGRARFEGDLEKALADNAACARFLRTDEDFGFLRDIWDAHYSDGAIDKATHAGFCSVLESICSIEGEITWPEDPLDLPDPISEDEDPRFQELLQRWIGALEHLREDPDVGNMVRVVEESKRNEMAT